MFTRCESGHLVARVTETFGSHFRRYLIHFPIALQYVPIDVRCDPMCVCVCVCVYVCVCVCVYVCTCVRVYVCT